MAKVNPLQEQLLKAGLVKKSKVAAVAREQAIAGGRAYLRVVPVTLLREFETKLMIVSSAGLVHQMAVFEANPMPGPDGEARE